MDDVDEVEMRYPGKSPFACFSRWFTRRVIVSEWIAKSSTRNLKSHASVRLEQKRQLKHYPCVIHPCSDGKHYWDCCMILISVVQLIITPLESGLGAIPESFPWINSALFQFTRLLFDLLCCLDIVIHFFTGYYDDVQKEMELEKSEIALNYLKTSFIVDLLSSVPTQWCWLFEDNKPGRFNSSCVTACRGVALLKLFRLYTLTVHGKRICDVYDINFFTRQIFYITFLYLIVWHIMSCCTFFFIAITNEISGGVYGRDMSEHNSIFLYTYMMYRGALYASISLGFNNDDKPGTVTYTLLSVQFVYSKIFQIYILARAIELLKAKNSAARTYVGIANQVVEFMRHKQLPVKVQDRITQYYEYHYHKEFFREADILRTVSGQLRRDILMQKCILFTTKVQFFKGLPMNLLERIVSLLQIQTYMLNDLIIKANTQGNRMYFISSGTVAVYTPRGTEICHLTDGEYFGEIALVSDNSSRVASVVALETTEVFILYKKDFVRTINPYPDLLEKVQRLAAERLDYTTHVEFKYNRD